MEGTGIEFETGVEDVFDDNPGEFDIGNTVIPVVKYRDLLDVKSVLVNPADSYIGKFVGEFLSDKPVGSSYKEDAGEADEYEGEFEGEGMAPRDPKTLWKVLGTLKDNKSEVPSWLWAVMRTDDYEAYLKEILKCSVIIYDITENTTPERIDEVRAVCDALREKVTTFTTRRVIILISSLHSWSHTIRPNDPEEFLSESDYRRRRTKPLYRDLQLLERYVVASGKMTKGMLKGYVVGAGAVYGAGEGPLHSWFKSAWHNAAYLPIYGTGKNFLPTIHIGDLAKIVQCIMDATPKKQRYILAVDPTICQQDQIIKAISTTLGTGRVKLVGEKDIYLNREVNTFQADQVMLDLRIESTFCKENFDIEYAAEEGFVSIIKKIEAEYKKTRNLEPLKLCILGPPGIGKSTIARQISDLYRLNHFTKEDLVRSTIQMLREIAGDANELDIAGVDQDLEDFKREQARTLLREVDSSLGENPTAQDSDYENESEMEQEQLNKRKSESLLEDSTIIALFRYRLLTNQCQNQGFILDGFPETAEQGKALFALGEDAGEFFDEEEAGEDGRDMMDPRIVPDKVIVLEASDEFLTQRLQKVPSGQLQNRHKEVTYSTLLGDYRDRMSDYERTFLYYMDTQEMIYFPIDITQDTSVMMISTVARISDMLGKPRNYGLTLEEEEALKNAQVFEQHRMDSAEKEDLAQIESKELDERRNNIQQWMEKLAKIKREEFEREEAALIPLRHYIMAHVVPTLTKGLIEVTRARPEDPVEFLAEFLFQHNPGSISSSGAQSFKTDML